MGLRITLKLQIQHVRTPRGRRRIVSRSRSWAMGFKADAPWLSKIKAETMERKAFMEEALLNLRSYECAISQGYVSEHGDLREVSELP